MRTFHIRVNAKIKCERYDKNDDVFYIDKDWDGELECDGVETFERLMKLNNVTKLNFSQIPSFIIYHLEYSSDIDFDNINDDIIELKTRLIREL